jgi:hypothetical protein
MGSIEVCQLKDNTKRNAILLGIVGIIIIVVATLFFKELSDKLSIGGIGATIIIAFLIYILQNKTSKELTKLTKQQTKTSEEISKLTKEIHNMTSVYSDIREQRIESFKHFTLHNLQRVKDRYNKLLEAMDKYLKTKDNKKEVLLYANNPTTQSIINIAQMMISFHFQYSKNFIRDINLVRYLEFDLNSLGNEFQEVASFDFDQYENNSNDYSERIDMISYDFNFLIEHVKEKINKIDEYIQRIEKE